MQIINIFAILLSLLMVGCGTVDGQTASASDLFSLEEVAALEESYGMSQDDLMKQLSLTEADLEVKDEFRMVPSELETIHGLPFYVTYQNSIQEPPGLYSVRFDSQNELDQKEAVKKAFDDLSAEAISLYGEPGQGPIKSTRTYDGVDGENITTRWKVGEQSSFSLTYSEQPDGVYLALAYSLVIPGSIHDFG